MNTSLLDDLAHYKTSTRLLSFRVEARRSSVINKSQSTLVWKHMLMKNKCLLLSTWRLLSHIITQGINTDACVVVIINKIRRVRNNAPTQQVLQ